MTPAEHPPLPVEKIYNPLVVVGLIGSVILVIAFFLAMLFFDLGKGVQVHRVPGDRQLQTNVPD